MRRSLAALALVFAALSISACGLGPPWSSSEPPPDPDELDCLAGESFGSTIIDAGGGGNGRVITFDESLGWAFEHYFPEYEFDPAILNDPDRLRLVNTKFGTSAMILEDGHARAKIEATETNGSWSSLSYSACDGFNETHAPNGPNI